MKCFGSPAGTKLESVSEEARERPFERGEVGGDGRADGSFDTLSDIAVSRTASKGALGGDDTLGIGSVSLAKLVGRPRAKAGKVEGSGSV